METVDAGAIPVDSAGFSTPTLMTFELACFLRISTWTVRDWRRRGVGPPFLKLSRKTIRYPKVALEEWLRGRLHAQTG
jgi:hypothetical protein